MLKSEYEAMQELEDKPTLTEVEQEQICHFHNLYKKIIWV